MGVSVITLTRLNTPSNKKLNTACLLAWGVTQKITNDIDNENLYMNGTELEYINKPSNPMRRNQRLAGRFLLKSLMLNQLNASNLKSKTNGESYPFPAWLFCRLHIINKPKKLSTNNKYLLAYWCNKELPDFFSISHKPALTAVVLNKKCVGIDIEKIKKRVPGFYKFSFTPIEKRWMKRVSGKTFDYRGTLLWTLKECFLKSGVYTDFSIMHFNKLCVILKNTQVSGEFNSGQAFFYTDRSFWQSYFFTKVINGHVLSILLDIEELKTLRKSYNEERV